MPKNSGVNLVGDGGLRYDISKDSLSIGRLRDAGYLAWKDFTIPYRRTLIGPVWEVLGAVMWIAGLSIVFYVPGAFSDRLGFVSYVACGIVSYNYIAQNLSGAPTLFVSSSSILLNIRISPFFLVVRRVLSGLLRFAAQMVAALLAVAFLGPGLQISALESLAGVLMVTIAALWGTTVLSLVGAKFHDMAHVAIFASRILLFISPIFWLPGSSGLRATLALYNPVTHFIALIRAPLLQQDVSMTNWLVVIGVNVTGIVLAVLVYRLMRPRLVNWI